MGSIEGGARLRPVIVPPPRRLLLSVLGGAREFGSVSSLVVDGMGVELDSDDFSVLSGGCIDGDGSGLMTLGVAGLTSAGKAASLSGERRITTNLLFLLALDVDLAVGVVDDMVGVGIDGGCGVGQWRVEWMELRRVVLWGSPL